MKKQKISKKRLWYLIPIVIYLVIIFLSSSLFFNRVLDIGVFSIDEIKILISCINGFLWLGIISYCFDRIINSIEKIFKE